MTNNAGYHTYEEYLKQGLHPFRMHTGAYLIGERSLPVSQTSSFSDKSQVFFSFSDQLLIRFFQKESSLEKAYSVALAYGFRGFSRGGKNGIFLQRKGDNGLGDSTEGLKQSHLEETVDFLEVDPNALDRLKKVKIVWHNPSGERLVGLYNSSNKKMIFLDFASY